MSRAFFQNQLEADAVLPERIHGFPRRGETLGNPGFKLFGHRVCKGAVLIGEIVQFPRIRNQVVQVPASGSRKSRVRVPR